VNTFEQIVRDIASQDPLRETSDREGFPSFWCRYCGVRSDWEFPRLPARQYVDEHHEPDCLGLRAKQAVEGAESFVVLKPLPEGTPLGYERSDDAGWLPFWVKITGLDYASGVSGGDICLDGTMTGTAYVEADQ
jgi:hypothetical protein